MYVFLRVTSICSQETWDLCSSECKAAEQGGRVNKLVSVCHKESADELELTQAVQELRQAAAAFILAVDPNNMDREGENGHYMRNKL